jgi:predicted Zn-dependent peptidase
LAVSGDFDPDVAKNLIERFFGGARKHAIPPYEPGKTPDWSQPRDAVVVDAHARFPAIMYAWPIPPRADADHYALELAADLLAGGESSRLHQLLVRQRALAGEVDAETDGHRGPDAFEITVKLSGGGSVPTVAHLVEEEIARLSKTPPTEAEMTKLRNQVQAGYVLGLQSNFARAQKLAEFEVYDGDANLVNAELGKYLAVTRDDIRRVVAKYLVPSRRASVEVKPGLRAEDEAETAPRAPARPAPPRSTGAAPAAPKNGAGATPAKK